MRRTLLTSVTVIALIVPSVNEAGAQTGTQRGATLGGLAGAVTGGIIGDHNDEAGAGAAIGGALGAVAGGLLGNAADRDAAAARQRYYHRQQQRTQQRSVPRQGCVSLADVASMSRSGLSDAVIINQIQQRGTARTLEVADIITLHQQGVSETVITAMQQAPVGPVARSAPPAREPTHVVTPAPVIIHERPVVPYYHPRFYRHRRFRPRYEVRVDF